MLNFCDINRTVNVMEMFSYGCSLMGKFVENYIQRSNKNNINSSMWANYHNWKWQTYFKKYFKMVEL